MSPGRMIVTFPSTFPGRVEFLAEVEYWDIDNIALRGAFGTAEWRSPPIDNTPFVGMDSGEVVTVVLDHMATDFEVRVEG